MKRLRLDSAVRAAFLTGLSLFVVTPVFAAEGIPTRSHFLGLPTWIWLTLNLVVFWGGLFYFAGPPVRRALERRGQRITEDFALVREQRREAAEMQSTLESRIDALRQEVDDMLDHSRRAAEQERDEILADTEKQKERLLAQTRDEIESSVAAAREKLQRKAASLAATLAAEHLQRELDGPQRDRLFDEALARLEKEAIQ